MSFATGPKNQKRIALAGTFAGLVLIAGIYWAVKPNSPKGSPAPEDSLETYKSIAAPEIDDSAPNGPVGDHQAEESGEVLSAVLPSTPIDAPATNPSESSEDKAVVPIEKKEVVQTGPHCFRATYALQKRIPKSIRDKIADYKNIIRLPKTDIDTHSVCIRVDGIPVKISEAKSKKAQFIIDSIATQESKIEATYCTQGHRCQETCLIPKDDFLTAIGGVTDDELSDLGNADSAWNNKKEKTAAQKKLKEEAKFIKEIVQLGEDDDQLFNGWTVEKEFPGCEKPAKAARRLKNSEDSKS